MRKIKKHGSKGGGAIAATIVILLLLTAALGYALWRRLIPTRLFLPLDYKEELLDSAHEYGLEPCLVAAVINTESSFKKDAVSVDGAEGLMQLLPSTAEWIAAMRGVGYDKQKLFEPGYNIDMGCWLLRYLTDRYGSTRYALIAYNAGHGRLESWLANEEYLDENGELAVIPYGETDAYVKKVERAIEQYKELYGEELENAKDDQ